MPLKATVKYPYTPGTSVKNQPEIDQEKAEAEFARFLNSMFNKDKQIDCEFGLINDNKSLGFALGVMKFMHKCAPYVLKTMFAATCTFGLLKLASAKIGFGEFAPPSSVGEFIKDVAFTTMFGSPVLWLLDAYGTGCQKNTLFESALAISKGVVSFMPAVMLKSIMKIICDTSNAGCCWC